MLKHIPPILSPDLLHALRAMGHGDEIAIVDANYPAQSAGPPVIRLDGLLATDVADAVLSLMPLDDFVDEQAFAMEVVGNPRKREQTHREFDKLVKKHEPAMKLAADDPRVMSCGHEVRLDRVSLADEIAKLRERVAADAGDGCAAPGILPDEIVDHVPAECLLEVQDIVRDA